MASLLLGVLGNSLTWSQPVGSSQLYEQYLKQLEQTREGAGKDRGSARYSSPDIYKDYSDSLFEEQKIEKQKSEAEEELKVREEKGFFLEPVVVDDETVQIIRKATPRELTIFGATLFESKGTGKYAPIPQTPISDDYILKVGDDVLIYLWGNVEKEFDLSIDREGKVFIPKAGTITLMGLTLAHAEEKLTRFLERIYSDFDIDITLGRVSNMKVYVFGEVNRPGGYILNGLSSCLNAMELAGGPTPVGSLRDIKIYRNGKLYKTVDLYDIIIGYKTNYSFPSLTANDIMFVPEAKNRVKLRGKVRHPAIFELKESETLTDVIDFAGGFLPEASKKNIMVDRVTEGKRNIESVDFTDSISRTQLDMMDGDDISVFPIPELRERYVSLAGHVAQPGEFAFKEGMKVSDLLKQGELLFDDTYMERADLIRITATREKKIVNIKLDSALVQDRHDLPLQERDKLILYSIWDVWWEKNITISGAVKNPGIYELYEDMRVSDLMFEAGGFLENTYLLEAELARIVPGQPASIFKIDLQEVMNTPGGAADLELNENDQLFIREIPGWKLQEIVTVVGEVQFPGKYALRQRGERLSDLIERAGGITNEAFLKGATFLRPSIENSMEERDLESIIYGTQEAILDSEGNISSIPLLFRYDPKRLSRIIINLQDALEGNEGENILLKDGDRVFIPKRPTGVSVVGAVPSSGTITFIKGKDVEYYIDKAGGFTKNADEGEMRLVKANGKVKKCNTGTQEIEPGDIIVVPQELKEPTDWNKVLKDAVSIISGIATTLYVLLKL